jgi:hypothetical protein
MAAWQPLLAAAAAPRHKPRMELHSDIWVAALIRRAMLGGAAATVVRKGEARSGAVLVKMFDAKSRAARLYAQALNAKGETVWMRPVQTDAETDIDAYVERAVRFDPDLWLVEIEDADGTRFLTEAVERD